MSVVKYLLAGVLVLGLAACGGDGGGGGNDGGDVSTGDGASTEPGPDPDPLVYNGNSSVAVLAEDNIAELIFAVFSESSADSTDSGGNIVATISAKRGAAAAIADSKTRKTSGGDDAPGIGLAASAMSVTAQAAEEFREVEDCDSGTITYTGEVDEDSIGYIITDYDNCVLDGVRTNGRTRLDVHEYERRYDTITKGTFEYKRLTTAYGVSSAGDTGDGSTTISGIVDFRILDLQEAIEETVSNMVVRIDGTGKMFRHEEVVEVIDYNSLNNGVPLSRTMSGRIYDSDYGYIDVETLSPILANPGASMEPALSGKFKITGASNAQALINVLGGGESYS